MEKCGEASSPLGRPLQMEQVPPKYFFAFGPVEYQAPGTPAEIPEEDTYRFWAYRRAGRRGWVAAGTAAPV